jgi:hypothetical protein
VNVSNALLVLTTLIIGSPAILWLDGPIMQALVTGAAGVAVVSCTMRPGEAIFFVSFARPAALLAAVPALWMLIQVVPMGLFAHPIWASAQAALGHPILGSISIDVGAGALALGRYLTIVAIGFWTAAAAIDRQRAEHILFALVAATGLIALIMTAAKLFGFGDFRSAAGPALMQATDSMVIGVIVAGAAMVRTLERYETRRANPGRSVTTLTATFAACAAAFTLCFGSLLALAPRSVLVPAGYGIGVVAAIVLIRRLDLGRWGIAGICASAIVVAAPVGAGYLGGAKQDFSFGFARPSPEALVSTTQRMLIDAPFLGTGAGTFAAIAPIYHDIDDSASFTTASTVAAAAAIELGRPILWLLVLTAGGAIAILLRAALRRGRDSFYAAAGAGTLMALLLLIFTNAGLLGTAPAMLAAATLGLAFAQCKSRSVPQ